MNRSLFEVFLLACLWGPTGVCIKYLSYKLPPVTIVASCSVISILVLTMILRINIFQVPRRIWKFCGVIGFVGHALPFTLLSFSIYFIESIWIGLSNALVPILTCVLAKLFLPNEALSQRRILGILIGFCSAAIIVVSTNNSYGQSTGIYLAASAALCYACNMVYVKKYVTEIPVLKRTYLQLLTSTIYLIPLAFILDAPLQMDMVDLKAILALLFLAVPGTVIAFALYHRIITHSGTSVLSLVNYILPGLKTILGVFLINETITVGFCTAIALILISCHLVADTNPLPNR